jgi:5-methylcytosine-specific restriction endonuclease McrA
MTETQKKRSRNSFLSAPSHPVRQFFSVEWVPLTNYHMPRVKRRVHTMTKKIVAAEQKWMCALCGQLLTACFEVDHIVRLEIGGSNERFNLEALCRECHGMKTAYEQAQQNEFLDPSLRYKKHNIKHNC